MILKYHKYYNSYKNRPFRGKYCQYYKLTSYSTNNCWLLFLNLAPKGQTPRDKRSKKVIKLPISTTKELYRAKTLNSKNRANPKILKEHEIKDQIISNIVDLPKSTKDIDILSNLSNLAIKLDKKELYISTKNQPLIEANN